MSGTYRYSGAAVTVSIGQADTVEITAAGGAGGTGSIQRSISNGIGNKPTLLDDAGAGGVASGDFFLPAGTTLEIVVGGEGRSSPKAMDGAGGGGGGTFVFEVEGSALIPLVVAGGGGGASFDIRPGGAGGLSGNGGNGSAGSYGGSAGYGGSPGHIASGAHTDLYGGGGGGGLNGNGGAAFGTIGAFGGDGPTSFQGGRAGKDSAHYTVMGGFGGGGAGDYRGGGGGGGFYGGGGGSGDVVNFGGGGGGSSYVAKIAVDPVLTDGANPGAGYVTFDTLLCFLRGTRILTPAGERPVESLQIGDEVTTRTGTHQIRWIGRQSYDRRFIAQNPDKQPVCIRAHALGQGTPARDLYVTPGHALLIGETLVLARNLVNGITITQDWAPERIDYFHIELDHHDCLVAEGTWAETFAQGCNLRAEFHNAAEFGALYPDGPKQADFALCAPRPLAGPELDAALRPVVARTAALVSPGALRGYVDQLSADGTLTGWAQDSAHPQLPVFLEVLAKGEVIATVLACDHRHDLEEAGIAQGRSAFAVQLPASAAPGTIEVRRHADQAVLAMTEACTASLRLAA